MEPKLFSGLEPKPNRSGSTPPQRCQYLRFGFRMLLFPRCTVCSIYYHRKSSGNPMNSTPNTCRALNYRPLSIFAPVLVTSSREKPLFFRYKQNLSLSRSSKIQQKLPASGFAASKQKNCAVRAAANVGCCCQQKGFVVRS